MFSSRARWHAPLNRLTIERRKRGGELLDLTVSNPTRAGLDYPLDELASAMAAGARAAHEPEPRGLFTAREAVAADIGCDADDLLLTASTSEAYSFLFKLLTDPHDEVLTAVPSYPLLEQLAGMEQVRLRHFELERHRRWEIDPERLRAAVTRRTRALVVVNPNNPTGSFVSPAEQDALAATGLPIVSDEVFLPYPLEGHGTSIVRQDVLTFTLGGLSKSAGLPHFKLGWIRVSGPLKSEALDALELIADNFLSVATPVQAALPEILAIAPRIRGAIATRIRANLGTARAAFATVPSAQLLPVEAGWSAVVRYPRVMSDEDFCLTLLDRGVLVQPGYFFDFPGDGYVVLSLLTREEAFAEGLRRINAQLESFG